MSLSFLIFIAGFVLSKPSPLIDPRNEVRFVAVRTGIWLVVWMVTGRDFWILPNIMQDEVHLALSSKCDLKKGHVD